MKKEVFVDKIKFSVVLVIGASVWLNELYAQPAFSFTYDASGNRIKRELIDLRDPAPDDPEDPELMVYDSSDFDVAEIAQEALPEQDKSADDERQGVISVYPNPTSDLVFIEFSDFDRESAGRFQVSSSSGQIVASSTDVLKRNEVNLSDEAAGYYLLKVELDGTVQEWIIVKD